MEVSPHLLDHTAVGEYATLQEPVEVQYRDLTAAVAGAGGVGGGVGWTYSRPICPRIAARRWPPGGICPGLGETSFKCGGRFSQSEWTTLQGLKGVAGKSLVIGPGGHGTGDMKYSNASVFISNLSLKSAVAGIVQGDVEFCISGVWTIGTF